MFYTFNLVVIANQTIDCDELTRDIVRAIRNEFHLLNRSIAIKINVVREMLTTEKVICVSFI